MRTQEEITHVHNALICVLNGRIPGLRLAEKDRTAAMAILNTLCWILEHKSEATAPIEETLAILNNNGYEPEIVRAIAEEYTPDKTGDSNMKRDTCSKCSRPAATTKMINGKPVKLCRQHAKGGVAGTPSGETIETKG